MEVLLNHLLKLGVPKHRMEAKVFGGGNVLPSMTHSSIGEKNAHFVLDFLRSEGIRLLSQDLGSDYPRKVYYFPAIGRVMVKRIRNMHNTTIIQREMDYMGRLHKTPMEGDVELF